MNKRAVLLFLIGFLSIIKINLVGVLTGSEIILILMFPFTAGKATRFSLKNPYLKKILTFWLLYFIGLVASDLIMGSTLNDLERGWSKVGILGLNIVMVAFLTRLDLERIMWYFWGAAFASFFDILTGSAFSNLWKFGMGPNITRLSSLVIGSNVLPISGITAALLFLALGIFHLLMNARSLAGFTLFAGLVVLFTSAKKDLKINPMKILNPKIAIPMGLVIGSIYVLYSFGAPIGWFGQETQKKYLEQTVGGRSFVKSSRGESAPAIAAIEDSPLWGHGSWAKDKKYVLIFLNSQGIDPSSGNGQYMLERGLIPTHSHLLGAWVEAGIFGFIFWVVVLRHAIYGLLCCVKAIKTPYRLYLIFSMTFFIWDLAFSPFGLERRLGNAGFIVLSVIFINRYQLSVKYNKFLEWKRRMAAEQLDSAGKILVLPDISKHH